MSDADPDDDRAEDLMALYRAANAADTARPSDAARRSILTYARTVAGGCTDRDTTAATMMPIAVTSSGTGHHRRGRAADGTRRGSGGGRTGTRERSSNDNPHR